MIQIRWLSNRRISSEFFHKIQIFYEIGDVPISTLCQSICIHKWRSIYYTYGRKKIFFILVSFYSLTFQNRRILFIAFHALLCTHLGVMQVYCSKTVPSKYLTTYKWRKIVCRCENLSMSEHVTLTKSNDFPSRQHTLRGSLYFNQWMASAKKTFLF